MRYLSNKIFLILIVCLVTLFPKVLHASCNEKDNLKVFKNDPKVFKVHGTVQNMYKIEGECFEEFLKAMGNGKDIDIKYAEIKGDINFTNAEFFQHHSFDEAEKELNEDSVSHLNSIIQSYGKQDIVIINGKIKIVNSIINGDIGILSGKRKVVCFFKKQVYFENTNFNSEANFSYAKFGSDADFSYADFGSEADFTVADFGSDADFFEAEFGSEANFSHAKFGSDANFSGAKFGSEVDFRGADFGSDADFVGADFGSDADFRGADFGSEAAFISADFGSDADFSNADFGSDANFYYADFGSEANFIDAKFGLEADFRYAEFDSDANFSYAEFGDNCSFNNTLFGIKSAYAEKSLTRRNIIKMIANDFGIDIEEVKNREWIFKGEEGKYLTLLKKDLKKELSSQTVNLIRYYRAAINEEILFRGELSAEKLLPVEKIKEPFPDTKISFEFTTFLKFADFRNSVFFGDTTFKETVFKEVGLFNNTFFFNAKNLKLVKENDENSLVSLDIDNSYFNLLKGLTYNQIFPNLHKRIKYPDDKEATQTIKKQSIEIYKYLQENFRKIGKFEDADEIYYKRKQLEAEMGKESLGLAIWNWCLDKTCEYGTSPGRIVIISLIVICFFWILYSITYFSIIEKGLGTIEYEQTKKRIHSENNEVTPKHTWYHHLWHSFYLSLNTFTTVGTGDIIATRILRVFVLIEGALGWFMLGLFIVVLSSKYFR